MAIAIEDKSENWFEEPARKREEFEFRYYLRTVLRHKWKILTLSCMSALLMLLMAYRMTPIYRSTATIMVESSPGKVLSVEEIYHNDARASEYFSTQFEILKSRDLQQQVVDHLKLQERPEYKEAVAEAKTKKGFDWRHWVPFELPPDRAAEEGKDVSEDAYRGPSLSEFGALVIKPRRQTQLVDMSFDSYDPVLSRDVVDTLGEAYIRSNVAARLDATRRANAWLADRMDGLRDKLAESEQRLQRFLEQEKLVDLQGVYTISSREIEGTTEKIVEARNARAGAESAYEKVKSLGSRITENLDAIPEMFDDPVLRELKQKEADGLNKVSELNKRYGPQHPTLVAAQAELDSINNLLTKQISSVVSSIKNRYDVARANENALVASLDKNKEQVQAIGRKQAELEELRREVQSNRSLYDMFLNRFKETSEAGDLLAANARFIDYGEINNAPVKPNKKMLVLMAFLGSGLLGMLMAIVSEQMHNTIRTPDDLDTKLGGVPLLGVLPVIEAAEKGMTADMATAYFNQNDAQFAESMRTVRTGIMLSALDVPHKVLLVTSTYPGEGKTSVAYNLALSMSQTMRILLIDADLRRSSVGKLCGLPPKTPGLADILAGESRLEDCLVTDKHSGSDVLTAGYSPVNALDLLASKAFTRLIEELETRYDAIVIDSPPIQAVSDAQLLAQYVTANIYVVEVDRTPVRAIRNSLKRLYACRAPIAGVILNKMDTRNAKRYGYIGYDNYGYGNSYLPDANYGKRKCA